MLIILSNLNGSWENKLPLQLLMAKHLPGLRYSCTPVSSAVRVFLPVHHLNELKQSKEKKIKMKSLWKFSKKKSLNNDDNDYKTN